MRLLRSTTKILLLIILAIFAWDETATAFHSGGVGPCDACHAMHVAGGLPDALLRASDAGSTCLHCHEHTGDVGPTKHHVSTALADMPQGVPPRQMTPAGDFGWLRKSYAWTPAAGQLPLTSSGDKHGHNVVANDYFYAPDMLNAAAPGGTYPSASLTCISCHDPHGKYRRNADGTVSTSGASVGSSGSYAAGPDPQAGFSVGTYRMLGGRGYQPKTTAGNFSFLNDPPAAVAPSEYNRSEAATQTRVAYGTGMSEWCQNCHTAMHTVVFPGGASGAETHPVGAAGRIDSGIAANYNSYIRTGNLAGTVTTAYLSLVPFEEGIANYAALRAHARSDDTYLAGIESATAQIACITCHRAHASGWDGAMRWNAKTEYIVYNGFYAQEGQAYQPYGQGRTELEALRAYQDMPASRFGLNQDSLCHKCHPGANP